MRLAIAASFTVLASVAVAQDQPNTVLVMDGSGSMWGQVDGIAKITIAQEVVGELLSDFPAEQGLGLTVYGHRARGECTDIETVVAPAPGTAGQIAAAVNGIKPLGKTPMTDAVIAAAEALRYTEDKATVILVSDGVETCNPDPCAAARLLEEVGIDFTAHVIGFDVGSDAEALAQMQCIAEETGGKFLTADTADQLTEALTQVAVAVPEPEPEPALVPTTLTAVIEGTDTLVPGPVLWDLTDNSGQVESERDGNPLTLDLVEGSFTATAYSTALETELSRQFVAIGDAAAVQIAFPEPKDTARILAPATAVAGSTIEVGWDGPNTENDYIGIGAVGADGAEMWRNWTYTKDGNPVSLLVVPEPGPHLIQYFQGATREVLGTAEIMVTPAEVTLAAPEDAAAGSVIEVDWTGPDYAQDYIGIGPVGAEDANRWRNWVYTADGAPAKLRVPPEPGDYEITYFMNQFRTPVHSIAFTATELETQIIAPAEAEAGSTIEVGWVGPDNKEDYIGIGRVDAEGSQAWQNWTYTRDGNPLKLLVPPEPGDYVITYFLSQDRTAMASQPIKVVAVGASVTAPSEAPAGSKIEVTWTGPDYPEDYIGIGRVDATGGSQWENWTYTRDGNPATLTLPAQPGDYQISYFQRQDRTALSTVPITLLPLASSVSAVSEAIAGETIEVTWTGPDYPEDYIGIGRVDATGGSQWENWTYTRDGNPATLTLPAQPGDYQISYFQRQDRTALSTVPITLLPLASSVSAVSEAIAGETIEVTWTGPDYPEDYIGIGRVDARGGEKWQNWVYTRDGSPAKLLLPATPGDYTIAYYQRQDRSALDSMTITLRSPEASLNAPTEAVAGSTITVDWTGPDYHEDYLGIGRVDARGGEQWKTWTRTSDGSPAQIVVPPTAGDYRLAYYIRQDRTRLVEVPLKVTTPPARVVAPASAKAGTSIEIGWDGPDYRDDYIAVGKVDAKGGMMWEAWSPTSNGNPVEVNLPETPGEYIVRYIMRLDRTILAEQPITLE